MSSEQIPSSLNGIRAAKKPGTLVRWLRLGAAALVSGSVLVACGSSASTSSATSTTAGAAKLISVTLARTNTNSLQLLALNVAQEQGYFQKNGIDAKIIVVNGDAASIPALVSGSVQFAVTTATPLLTAVSKGAEIQAITALSNPPEQIVMSAAAAKAAGITNSSPIKKRVEALAGKTVAVLDVGGGLQYTLDAVLQTYGVAIDAVPVIGITPYSSELAALKSGAISVIAPSVPYGNQAVHTNGAVMIADVWGGQVPGMSTTPFEVLDVQKSWASAHQAAVKAVRTAIGEALNYIHSNPQGTIAIAEQISGSVIAPSVIQAAVGNGAGFASNTTISSSEFSGMTSFAKLSGANAAANVSFTDAISPLAR